MPTPASKKAIDDCRKLYIKYNGRHHRRIESEMRKKGWTTFRRRILYTRKNARSETPGWAERFNWNELPPENKGRNATVKERVSLPVKERVSATFGTASDSERASPNIVEKVAIVERAIRDPKTAIPNSKSDDDFYHWLKAVSPNFKWDWHYQHYIYKKLQAVTSGDCKRLMIFLPPRHGKSEMVTVRYSAYRLEKDPALNIILGSYNQKLANRFSRKIRRVLSDNSVREAVSAGSSSSCSSCSVDNSFPLMEEKVFNGETKGTKETHVTNPEQETCGCTYRCANKGQSKIQNPKSKIGIFPFARPANTIAEWETRAGGGVRAVGVGGGVTGFGAGLIVIDDPVKNRAEAESETIRENVWDWFNDDIYTRLEPDAAIILIQTRWHDDDLAGRLLKEMDNGGEQWAVVNLPALAEPRDGNATVMESVSSSADDTLLNSRVSDTLLESRVSGSSEPPSTDVLDRLEGEALCPERFDTEALLRIKKKLGSYSFSALYQQRPVPLEGGLFKRTWFKKFADKCPAGLRWARGYDLAVSTKTSADYTASFRCAFDKEGNLYIGDGFRKRVEYPEQRRYVIERIKAERDTQHGIELALHGQAFIQELRREVKLGSSAFRGVRVDTDKFTRALAWANLAEEGKVYIVRGAWNQDFLDEVCRFTGRGDKHDDQVDAVSLAVQMLAGTGSAFHTF